MWSLGSCSTPVRKRVWIFLVGWQTKVPLGIRDWTRFLYGPILHEYQPIRTKNKTVHSRTTVEHIKLDFDENTSFEYKLQIWKKRIVWKSGWNLILHVTTTFWRHFKMVSTMKCWWQTTQNYHQHNIVINITVDSKLLTQNLEIKVNLWSKLYPCYVEIGYKNNFNSQMKWRHVQFRNVPNHSTLGFY